MLKPESAARTVRVITTAKSVMSEFAAKSVVTVTAAKSVMHFAIERVMRLRAGIGFGPSGS